MARSEPTAVSLPLGTRTSHRSILTYGSPPATLSHRVPSQASAQSDSSRHAWCLPGVPDGSHRSDTAPSLPVEKSCKRTVRLLPGTTGDIRRNLYSGWEIWVLKRCIHISCSLEEVGKVNDANDVPYVAVHAI